MQNIAGVLSFPFVPHFPQPNQWKAEVSQRGQITGSAEGALLIDDRNDIFVIVVD
jgi:hypothetical protein